MNNKFLEEYKGFVDQVTSKESKNTEDFINRINQLESSGVNIARFLTAGIGLASESGEFNELLKKMCFQGKPINDDNLFHLKRELGDIMWYWTQACMALNLDPIEVIKENIHKLESRYPGGFDSWRSENRKANDL